MGKVKVLLVDDSELTIQLEKSFLLRENIDILTAYNGQEALDKIKNQHPDLVFLDLHLPDISGDRICKAIKENPGLKGTKVVIATMDSREETVELCKKIGCDEFLQKPIKKSEFLAAMGKVLGISARRQPRVICDIPCIAHIGLEGYESRILNISVLGIYLQIDPVPEKNRILELNFAVPPMEDNIVVKAIVKWTSNSVEKQLPPGAGMAFMRLPKDIEDLISDFVESRL